MPPSTRAAAASPVKRTPLKRSQGDDHDADFSPSDDQELSDEAQSDFEDSQGSEIEHTKRGSKAKSRKESKSKTTQGASSSQAIKKRKIRDGAQLSGKDLIHRVFGARIFLDENVASLPPQRSHAFVYHQPLLLDCGPDGLGEKARNALLTWFDRVKEDRKMPWRSTWIDPEKTKGASALLKERAYRVWISEIMLQQTRVATVIDYFNRWMHKWPSIEDLANAEPDEVLAAWKGLGYYSRSARIHEAAKKVAADKNMQGLLPELPQDLSREVPGVGPYTAGAISSIVFGHAVPIVDGNVIRVLCRQMGLMASTKEKATMDFLWESARRLVRRIALDSLPDHRSEDPGEEAETVNGDQLLPRSKVPGGWNQALMELGRSVPCSAKACYSGQLKFFGASLLQHYLRSKAIMPPVSYSEYLQGISRGEQVMRVFFFTTLTCSSDSNSQGSLLRQAGSSSAAKELPIPDLEDICSVCEPVPILDDTLERSSAPKKSGKAAANRLKQSKLSFGSKSGALPSAAPPSPQSLDPVIENHVKLMPLKSEKAKVKEEHCAVCIIEDPSEESGKGKASYFLLEQRPPQGLLANMWQLPTLSFGFDEPPSAPKRAAAALDFARAVVARHPRLAKGGNVNVGAAKPLGAIQHVFSHLIWNMHIYTFSLNRSMASAGTTSAQKEQQIKDMTRKWCLPSEVTAINMGTGHVNIWKRFDKALL